MKKLPFHKRVLELSKESISIKKSFLVGGGGVGVGWVQPITMSASWQELNPKKEKTIARNYCHCPVRAICPAMPLDNIFSNTICGQSMALVHCNTSYWLYYTCIIHLPRYPDQTIYLQICNGASQVQRQID